MSLFITESKTPLEPDTLGAIKISEFHGDIIPVYCYARIYSYNGGLCISLKVFERVDIAKCRITFKLTSVNEEGILYTEIENNNPPTCYTILNEERNNVASLGADFISGDDNQGFYWGVEFSLTKEQLCKIPLNVESGNIFLANIIMTNNTESGYGCAFKNEDKYGDFLVVPY